MARPKTTPENTEQAKLYIDSELLAFIDEQAEMHNRSRSYVVNQAVRRWRVALESDRRRRKQSRKRPV